MPDKPISFQGDEFKNIGAGNLDPSVLPSTVVRTDGSTPFVAAQTGVAPSLDAHLATQGSVKTQLGALAWQGTVKSSTTSAQPGSPTTGDRYILPVGATGGSWSGHDKAIATWGGASWTFQTPSTGWTAYVVDTGMFWRYATTWADISATVTHETLAGLLGGASSDHYHITGAEHTILTGSHAARQVLASPTGAPGAPVSRALEAADITVGQLPGSHGGLGTDASAAAGYGKWTAGVPSFSSTIPWADISTPPSTFTPALHAVSHGSGGSDEVSLDAAQITTGVVSAAQGGTGQDGSSVTANYVLASPDGSSGAVDYRQVVPADITGSTGANQVLRRNSANTANVWATVDVMTGANGIAAGTSGLVPIPGATDNVNFLRGDGTWVAGASGEANTASNQGLSGVGPFLTKVGIDLQFKNIAPASGSVLTVTNNGGNKTVDLDVPVMIGATGSVAGTKGLVPDGLATDNVKFLRGDGTWATVTSGVSAVNTRSGSVTLVGTDIPAFVASGGSHAPGAVPDPGASAGTTKFLREDASWAIPPVFIASGGSHAVGYVPDPGASGGSTKFLREDATWAVPVGEANTASNQGGSGAGVFITKVGVDLQFKTIFVNGASALTLFDDISDHSIDLDVSTMVGATGAVAGTKGIVPGPASTDNVNFLRGDATWADATPAGLKTPAATPSGTALVGGILTGNARGTDAVDIQKSHATSTEVASGTRSVAIGDDNTVSGPSAVGIGDTNVASGGQAIAIGKTSSASGNVGIAIGLTSAASAAYGTAVGAHSAASATYATAIGRYAAAGQSKAIAIGDHSTATASGAVSSIAIGDTSTAAEDSTIAIGHSSSASGVDSLAIGHTAVATVANDIAIGGSVTANGGGYGPCIVIGRTASATTKGIAIGDTVTATGNKAVAIGANSEATQKQAVAIGAQALANNAASSYAVAIGAYSSAAGTASIVIGRQAAAQSFAENSIAIGRLTIAGGVGSIILSGHYMANYRPQTINVSAFHLVPAPYHGTDDAIAYGWDYSGAQSCVSTGPINLKTINTRRSIAFPQYCAMFLDRVSVIATAANTVTVQPQLRITGGNRTSPSTTTTGTGAPGSTVSIQVTDSTGFSTGDWVVFDSAGDKTRTALPVAAGKLSNVADGTHITVDILTTSVASGVTVTKLDATDYNILAATATSGLTAAAKRSDLASPNTDGHEVLIVDVSTAATATTLTGRVFFGGTLIDINPNGRFDYT